MSAIKNFNTDVFVQDVQEKLDYLSDDELEIFILKADYIKSYAEIKLRKNRGLEDER